MGTIDYNVQSQQAQWQSQLITMLKRARFWLSSTTAAALAFLLLLSPAYGDSALEVGDQAADWVLLDQEGKTVSFYQDSNQRPAVLLFWASWCSACAELLPELNALQQQLEQEDIRFYALNIWEDAASSSYLENNDFGFTLLLNADRVAKRYKVRRTPGLFVVNPDKSIGYIRRADSSDEEIFQAIKSVAAAQQ